MAKLNGTSGLAVKPLMLAILTAARSVEVFGMTWDGVDLDAKRWAVRNRPAWAAGAGARG